MANPENHSQVLDVINDVFDYLANEDEDEASQNVRNVLSERYDINIRDLQRCKEFISSLTDLVDDQRY